MSLYGKYPTCSANHNRYNTMVRCDSMKQVDFKGGRLKKETDEVVFIFDVELREGRDYDGKFDMAFGLAELDDTIHFVLLADENKQQPNIMGTFSTSDSLEVINALIDSEQYYTAINYDNVEHESIHGSVMKPLLGRDIGKQYDVYQKRELDESFIAKFEQMKKHLEIIDN